ncbi:hypothetical protein SNOG_08250 [Parastagonospora nodorum SN15]|uniref:DDE-1 domain-containing protein n=1 Tax=Phaeosphaeria nodorum (strain SN15 / ATCC MYA-4574 / FGSC 10173) TaxID=321614 RepID=Q0UJ14_PHANO|nr:hypothetical protein SNOG_08250 [Parastagonospora nodorum SN15]EAT84526.1 hypothetical protein SNOG_08250 [Parastagonospora nodorum SN15]
MFLDQPSKTDAPKPPHDVIPTMVGEKWARNLVKRKPEVKSQVTRQRDHQRVLCSNPAIISPWFNLVRNVKAKYGILDEDTYNFDETGFQIGVGGSVKVVTASERRLRPLQVQPGDREWVTLIAGINAMGWVIPPFFIFKAKNHDQAWYHNPKDWRIGVSKNGWTTNELGLEWLKHFIQHTTARTVGSHRLLIIDGHESHKSLAFQDLCEESKIITLSNSDITHIDKKAFLDTFNQVFDKAFSKDNILSSFQATGLLPDNPEVVLSKLEVKPYTPSPPPLGPTTWQPKTPSNAAEIEAQSTLILKRIRDYRSSSAESLQGMVQQFQKGAEMMVHTQVLMAAEIVRLRAANKAASERKARKRKRIQHGGTLSQQEAEEIIERRDAEALVEAERCEERVQAGGGSKGIRRCKTCSEVGHNKRTCKKDAAESGD